MSSESKGQCYTTNHVLKLVDDVVETLNIDQVV